MSLTSLKSVQQVLHKSSPPAEGPIPWGEVWDRRHWASITWVNSHKDAAHFDARGWPQWRREINADVDDHFRLADFSFNFRKLICRAFGEACKAQLNDLFH